MTRQKGKRTAPDPRPPRSGLHLAFLALCGIGLLFSADLLRVHINVHTDPGYHSYCSVNEGLDCAAVAASEYSVFWGLPLALWGLVGYLAMAAWAELGARSRGAGTAWPWGVLCGVGTLLSVASIFLLYVSHFIIHSICLVCAGSYIINIALLVVAILEVRRRGVSVVSAMVADVGEAARRPGLPLIFVALLAGAVMILKASITPYWTIIIDGPDGLAAGTTATGQPWIGAVDPVVEIIEYSDYQCPHCLRGHNAMRDLVRANPDRVRLIHRHYPLDQACNPRITQPFHRFACSYARLAWCAGEQGQFWEANDYIFLQGRRTDRVTPAELARQLGLDAADLTACESGRESAREVDHDLKAGREAGVGATPTFVMNGQVFTGSIPPEALAAALGTGPATPP